MLVVPPYYWLVLGVGILRLQPLFDSFPTYVYALLQRFIMLFLSGLVPACRIVVYLRYPLLRFYVVVHMNYMM